MQIDQGAGAFLRNLLQGAAHQVAAIAIAGAVVAVPVIMIATPYRAIIMASFPMINSERLPFQVAFEPRQGPVDGSPEAESDRRITHSSFQSQETFWARR